MRKNDTIFLGAVLVFAIVFVAMTLSAIPQSVKGGGASERLGVGGQARDVDMPRLQRLIREQDLSAHEAEFYHRIEPTTNMTPVKPPVTSAQSPREVPR